MVVSRSAWRIGIVASLAAAGVFFVFSHAGKPYAEAQTIGQNTNSFHELETRFQELAQSKGGVYAYEVLRRSPVPPGSDMHLLGHVVGDELYKQVGVSGIAYCTQEFRNACSHSMVIGALQDFGEGALSTIRDACQKAPGGVGAYTMCYHGLGHGVFSFFKYDFPATIALCKKMGTAEYQHHEYIQCVGGAVMELMGGGGGHDPVNWEAARKRYLTPNHPLAPCTLSFMPDEAKEMCYIYITPRLWEEAGIDLSNPDSKLFAKAFSYCDELPQDQDAWRRTCYGGFGKEFIPLLAARDIRAVTSLGDDALKTALSWCALAGVRDGRDACIEEEVSSLFWGGENDSSAAFRLCSLAENTDRVSCYGKLVSSIATYVRSSAERDALCDALPQDFKMPCRSAKPATP